VFTWVTFWPFLAIPSLVMIGLGGLVTVRFYGHLLGGEPIRQWCIDYLVFTWMPDSAGDRIVVWLSHAPLVHQWILYLLIAVNVNVLLLPAFYLIGEGILRFHHWGVRKDLELKRGTT